MEVHAVDSSSKLVDQPITYEHDTLTETTELEPIGQDSTTTKPKQKLTWWVVWSLFITVMAGTYQYGYSIGSVNAAAIPIRRSVQQYHMNKYNSTLSEGKLQIISVTIVAAFPVGGFLGSCLITNLRQYGYVKSMAALHAITVFGSILLGISKLAQSFEVLIIGRILIGIVSSTAGTGIAPMYIVEVSPKQYRGMFGSLISLFIALGIFIANILGLQEILGTDDLWPVFLSLTCLPSVLFISLCYFMPPSPRRLYLNAGDKTGAENLLKRLRDNDDVTDELDGLDQELKERKKTKQMSLWEIVTSSHLRRQVIAAVVISSCQQLTGMNGVQFYMNELYRLSGIPNAIIPYCAIATAGVLVVATVIVSLAAEKSGRRNFLVAGFGIESVSLLCLSVASVTQSLAPWVPYIAILCALCFIIGFSIGPGPMTLTCVAESFSQSSRSAALTLSCLVLWFSFTLLVVAWPYIQAALGGYAYLVFSVIAALCCIYVYFSIPETKNRSFIEIEHSYKQLKLPSCLSTSNTVVTDTNNHDNTTTV
uniref:solute carrier family 2, facilitated glucose transporter member 5 isoform X1 n=1 Tax=Ciona intestinalis TaxID=7719 RepID=UPI00006A380F|nr:solute carrier family 2, facilitated glucose transporter member 5 isoform X1 [Ciona intestinalis]|eukprot:XP_002127291.1 solute carrier family 2, facilitated glucose transporter member 5 isoform X1 [Ciona intestinalis]